MTMRILYIRQENICRSPILEFLGKDLAQKTSLERQFCIESVATRTEEIGYPSRKCMPAEHGINCIAKATRQLTNPNYNKHALLIGMSRANLQNMYLLMDCTNHTGDVVDLWYAGDFKTT